MLPQSAACMRLRDVFSMRHVRNLSNRSSDCPLSTTIEKCSNISSLSSSACTSGAMLPQTSPAPAPLCARPHCETPSAAPAAARAVISNSSDSISLGRLVRQLLHERLDGLGACYRVGQLLILAASLLLVAKRFGLGGFGMLVYGLAVDGQP